MELTEEDVRKISKEAAKEIAGCFDISTPRGLNYRNGITETIRIVIEQQIIHKGDARKH